MTPSAAPIDSVSWPLETVLHSLETLLADIERAEAESAEVIERVLPEHRESARNLIHYVEVRQHDLRPLQQALANYGLSSLGRMESIVRSWLLTVIETVRALIEDRRRYDIWGPLDGGHALLTRNTSALLGEPHSSSRHTRIMVTMPSEAAEDATLVKRMGTRGMDIARINCAHDDETAWSSMVKSVRSIPDNVLVAMDLGGPKLRTGPLSDGPKVKRVKPTRDQRGATVASSQCWLVPVQQLDEFTNVEHDVIPAATPLPDQWRCGDVLKFKDARGRSRKLTIAKLVDGAALLTCERTAYYETGLLLRDKLGGSVRVGELEPLRQHCFVRAGDTITLLRDMTAQPATHCGPHRIGCSLAEAFTDAAPGERVLFDDGKIEGVIRHVSNEEITVEVQRAGVNGVKLRAEKGINLPDTVLRIPALTAADRAHLPFVANNADLVNLSFVRSAADVADLIDELEQLHAKRLGITLKIETEAGFSNLPQMLLEAMRWSNVGVMIARGDLAVELGFDRMAEVQEEILWLCEAAHVPVIWATQVLDTLARTGLPSRAEVTDAAMGRRAEAVMLNKGPFIVDAIASLNSILSRMGGHLSKKKSLLRPLASFSMSAGETREKDREVTPVDFD